MKKLVCILAIFTVLAACKKDDDVINSEPITVVLSSNVAGVLSDSPTITYRDETGALKSEILPIETWTKTFTVAKGFNLLLKVSGTLNGSIEVKASATGGGVTFDDVKNRSSNVDTNLDLEIATTL